MVAHKTLSGVGPRALVMETLRLVPPPPSPSWSAFVRDVLAGARDRETYQEGWRALLDGFAEARRSRSVPDERELEAVLADKLQRAATCARQALSAPASRAAERAFRYMAEVGRFWMRKFTEVGVDPMMVAEVAREIDVKHPLSAEILAAQLLTFALLELVQTDLNHRGAHDIAFDASSAWSKVDMLLRSQGFFVDPWADETVEERASRLAADAAERMSIDWSGLDETLHEARLEHLR